MRSFRSSRQLGPQRRGFTLAELLVGLAVTSIVMTAVVAIFIGVQRSYQAETEVKLMTENGRGALMFIERVLPLAGYGLDPRLAIDVTRTQTDDNTRVQSVSFNPSQPAMQGAANTIVTDDLAFRYRDPAFLRAGRLNSGNTQVSLDTALGLTLPVGKLLMVGCRGATDYAMVRVTTEAGPAATTVAVTNAGGPFVTSAAACLTSTGTASPWVFMVQEHRLRIVNLGGRPWLVSFRNLEASVTDLSLNNFDPIAPDVEGFHVAFAMNRAPPGGCCQGAPDTTGNSNFIVGDALTETFFAQPASVLTTQPDYRASYNHASRFAMHPANIRHVHIGLVMRSSRALVQDRAVLQTDDLFNYDAPTPAFDGFRRSLFHTAIAVPNLMSRNGFMPSLRSAADQRDLNSWGG